jgi:hypothetical protein
MRKTVIVITVTAGCVIAALTGCSQTSQHTSRAAKNATGHTVASVGTSPTGVTCAKITPIPVWLAPTSHPPRDIVPQPSGPAARQQSSSGTPVGQPPGPAGFPCPGTDGAHDPVLAQWGSERITDYP